jgi:hypothetical protein
VDRIYVQGQGLRFRGWKEADVEYQEVFVMSDAPNKVSAMESPDGLKLDPTTARIGPRGLP